MKKIFKATMAILFFLPSLLATGENLNLVNSLKPYKATYKSKIKGIDLIFVRQLTLEENGDFLLEVKGSKLIFQLSEIARFNQTGATLVPISYKYKLDGITKRKKELQFINKTAIIKSLDKNKWFTLQNGKGVLDRLSFQEQLRLLLLSNSKIPEKINFRVADGPRIKDYKFIYLGEEILRTNLGNKKTIRYARDFGNPSRLDQVWLAPDLDFLMVKHIHQEKGKLNEAMVMEVFMEGQKVERK